MDRRTFLASAAAALGGLAGCSAPASEADGARSRAETPAPRTAPPAATTPARKRTAAGVDLPLPMEAFRIGGFKDSIPAIVDPAFGDDWSDVRLPVSEDRITEEFRFDFTPRLADGERVVGVERDGEARAYPLAVLNWHEVVNDDFGGPLLVTYCPLCGSGVVARRLVRGDPTIFGVSGLLYRSNLVLYDRATESLWSQVLARAVHGPLTGDRLELLPSTLTTWGQWRADYPDAEVLLPPPLSGTVRENAVRDYEQNPYAGYGNSSRIGIGPRGFADDRLPAKSTVIGVEAGGKARAYPATAVRREGVINDRVGGLPVVVAVGPDGTLVAYEREVDGRTLRFEPGEGGHMRAGGSRWTVTTGEAVDGPYDGRTLERANDRSPLFWFSWLDFNPDTTVYGRGG